ncbi:MAG: hypothetical protein IKE55_08775, partial [Kiritimatiellae bacterium]|nr:hypothetical protein [Kiritimatiellia bacterium]
MKGLASELATLATVLAIPAGIAAIFPYSAIGWRARPSAARQPAVAFVTLTAEEEAAATRAAKAYWQNDAGSMMRIRADLSFGELPAAPEEAVLDVSARTRPPRAGDVGWEAPAFLPSRAAPPPQPISDLMGH